LVTREQGINQIDRKKAAFPSLPKAPIKNVSVAKRVPGMPLLPQSRSTGDLPQWDTASTSTSAKASNDAARELSLEESLSSWATVIKGG